MAPYAGASLEKKLGLKGCTTLRLLGAPKELTQKLASARQADGEADLVMLFVHTPTELGERLGAAMDSVAERGSLWIAWPKGGKGARGEVTQLLVREQGMAAGWVDYKVASLDGTWSALRFARRD